MKSKVLILLIFIILTTLILGSITYKENINTATYDELIQINGIGDTLANRVLSYLDSNKNATIEDLDDIQGIGEGKLALIRKVYGD